MKTDPDYEWLLGHLPKDGALPDRARLAGKISGLLKERVETGMLPYTLGVFGGWGSGKTTFLAMLAKRLQEFPGYRVIYFNSWKYAGFMEIVPSLIYKILQHGVAGTNQNRNEAAMRVLLSLGKEYSDRFGEWAEKRIGVNPVGLFKDVYKLKEIVAEGKEAVRPELLTAYYNQVDKAQDVLAEVLGQIVPGKAAANPVIVLIDELDRCDPDEAFTVIKQMRVLFAMRQVPIAFVVCANPDPIGLAIKHRYGLESASGDYEARRILEKFVDAYQDFSEPSEIEGLVESIWNSNEAAAVLPWIVAVDTANGDIGYAMHTVRNARALNVITTAIPQYANLRVLRKSFDYVNSRAEDWNRRLLWTAWHLEIVGQIDPGLRQDIRTLAQHLSHVVTDSYVQMAGTSYRFQRMAKAHQLIYQSEKGATLFAIFRSLFWENARSVLAALRLDEDPQARERAGVLERLLANPSRMDFLILMSLLCFNDTPSHGKLSSLKEGTLPNTSGELDGGLRSMFGWLLANY
jgi:KAP family P-loop domain